MKPIIRIKQATTQGWIEMDSGGVATSLFQLARQEGAELRNVGKSAPRLLLLEVYTG